MGGTVGVFFLGIIAFFGWGAWLSWRESEWVFFALFLVGFLFSSSAIVAVGLELLESWQADRKKKLKESLEAARAAQEDSKSWEKSPGYRELEALLEDVVQEATARNLKLYGTVGIPEEHLE